MFNLRQKGIVSDYDFQSVYYLSIHFLDSAENAGYGKQRVLRELLDAWCDKKMTYAGVKYNDADAKLSEAELASIPGAECIKSIDSLKLEVTVRAGSAVDIHPDQKKQWEAQGGNYAVEFGKLEAHHEKHFKNLLAGVIQAQGGEGATPAQENQVVPVADEADTTAGAASAEVYESMDALKAKDELKFKAVSEIGDVELWRGKSNSTYLVATKRNRDLPAHTLLGGFGTGKTFD